MGMFSWSFKPAQSAPPAAYIPGIGYVVQSSTTSTPAPAPSAPKLFSTPSAEAAAVIAEQKKKALLIESLRNLAATGMIALPNDGALLTASVSDLETMQKAAFHATFDAISERDLKAYLSVIRPEDMNEWYNKPILERQPFEIHGNKWTFFDSGLPHTGDVLKGCGTAPGLLIDANRARRLSAYYAFHVKAQAYIDAAKQIRAALPKAGEDKNYDQGDMRGEENLRKFFLDHFFYFVFRTPARTFSGAEVDHIADVGWDYTFKPSVNVDAQIEDLLSALTPEQVYNLMRAGVEVINKVDPHKSPWGYVVAGVAIVGAVAAAVVTAGAASPALAAAIGSTITTGATVTAAASTAVGIGAKLSGGDVLGAAKDAGDLGGIDTAEFNVPQISLPKIDPPKIAAPTVSTALPSMPSAPAVSLPKVSVPVMPPVAAPSLKDIQGLVAGMLAADKAPTRTAAASSGGAVASTEVKKVSPVQAGVPLALAAVVLFFLLSKGKV